MASHHGVRAIIFGKWFPRVTRCSFTHLGATETVASGDYSLEFTAGILSALTCARIISQKRVFEIFTRLYVTRRKCERGELAKLVLTAARV